MVESLKELNAICQKPHYREVGNWMVRRVLRDLALPVTWFLLHTPVTANQMTALAFLAGGTGAALMAFPSSAAFLAGALFLQFWYYLDHVDGQIARYRGTACLTGRFFDFVMHQVIHGLILFALGFFVFQQTGQAVFVIWGFAGSLSTMTFNYLYDAQYKTFFEKLRTLDRVEIRRSEELPPKPQSRTPSGKFKKLFSLCHKLHEIHVMMNILTLAAVLQFVPGFRAIPWRTLLFVFYGLAAPLLAFVKLAYMLRKRAVDAEFDALFKISPEKIRAGGLS